MAITSSRGISLANKCQLLFGLAVLLILTAALSVPWFRMQHMIDEKEFDLARQIADAWLAGELTVHEPAPLDDLIEVDEPPAPDESTPTPIGQREANEDRSAEDDDEEAADPKPSRPALVVRAVEIREVPELDPPLAGFARDALGWFRERSDEHAFYQVARDADQPTRYRYARRLRGESLDEIRDSFANRAAGRDESAGAATDAPMWGVLVVDRRATSAVSQIYINRFYIVLAGLMAGALAILVFYFITTRLILSPVRVLRETAERASQGDLYVRSDISTGDEFEELSDTFNLMLANLKQSQDQLRKVNKGLDLKLNELAESNVTLIESSRLKSEFLANVSHELRTPLNSIIGFAEVVQDLDDRSSESPERDKRRRYVDNILTSGRSLLELINDLLDLAKIEAGRLDIEPEPTNVADVCEGLATLIRPQAEKTGIELDVEVATSTPIIETDPGRFEQIIFNFLSNAVKFTPRGGRVRLHAERHWTRDQGETVRVSVSDTGPGISPEDQEIIFEKFRQVDASHTRQHQGTGLGLAICRELSRLLGGSVSVESVPGEGSTFTLTLPVKLTPVAPQSLMPAAPPSTA